MFLFSEKKKKKQYQHNVQQQYSSSPPYPSYQPHYAQPLPPTPLPPPEPDPVVPLSEFESLKKNFRVAHAQVEDQRTQIQTQDSQIESLKGLIAKLEGNLSQGSGISISGSNRGGSSTDDFSIKNSASILSSAVNRFAAFIVLTRRDLHPAIRVAILNDNLGSFELHADVSPLRIQSLLRHAISEVISAGCINVLLVTDSSEANVQLSRIYDQLFERDPVVASIWRRQTFSASVESFSTHLQLQTLADHMPSLLPIMLSLNPLDSAISSSSPEPVIPPQLEEILLTSWTFSRMLHASRPSSGCSANAFYSAFVPEIGISLDSSKVELIKRCLLAERGEFDVVGACLFPGLVKNGKDPQGGELPPTVVRRAQIICACALTPQPSSNPPGHQQQLPAQPSSTRPPLPPQQHQSRLPPARQQTALVPLSPTQPLHTQNRTETDQVSPVRSSVSDGKTLFQPRPLQGLCPTALGTPGGETPLNEDGARDYGFPSVRTAGEGAL